MLHTMRLPNIRQNQKRLHEKTKTNKEKTKIDWKKANDKFERDKEQLTTFR